MSRGLRSFLLVAATLVGLGTKADAQDLTVLINRSEGATELFLAARADVLFDMMRASPTIFATKNGTVDFAKLRYGTFEAGDELLARTSVLIAGEDAGFEAMSLMAHPLEEKLPMRTPMEALIAIGICTGPPSGTFISIDGLQAYAGYFTDVDARGASVSIQFPYTRHAEQLVTVHDVSNSGQITSYQTKLGPNGTLMLNRQTDAGMPFAFLIICVLLISLAGLIWRAKRSNFLATSMGLMKHT
jgi:hypothetical protein